MARSSTQFGSAQPVLGSTWLGDRIGAYCPNCNSGFGLAWLQARLGRLGWSGSAWLEALPTPSTAQNLDRLEVRYSARFCSRPGLVFRFGDRLSVRRGTRFGLALGPTQARRSAQLCSRTGLARNWLGLT